MNKEKRRKTIRYKLAKLPKTDQVLKDLLDKAISKDGKAYLSGQRIQYLTDENTEYRVLMKSKSVDGIFYGCIAYIECGKIPHAMILDPQADQCEYEPVDMKNLLSSSSNGNNPEFPESILYFVVVDDHVAIVQSKSLDAKDLEYYLSWMLGGECCKLIDGPLILSDQPTEEARQAMACLPAKELIIEEPVYTTNTSDSSSSDGSQVLGGQMVAKEARFSLYGKGAEILKDFFGQNSATLSDALDDANLVVQVVVKYNRRTTEGGQRLLDQLATTLRHTPDENVKIVLKNGSTLTGKDLRVSGAVYANFLNGTLLYDDLWHDMATWLTTDAKVML